MLDNLTLALLGPVAKSTVNGRTVWSTPCTGYTSGVPGLPMNPNEGFICYLIRLASKIGIFNGGVWNSAVTYTAQTLVSYGTSLWVSLVSNTNVVPGSDSAIWQLMLTAPNGNPGPQGPPGPSGSAGNPNYAVRTTTTNTNLSETDGVLVCKNTSPMTVTVPVGSGLTSGKYFYVKQAKTSTAAVTVQFSGSDAVDGNTSYVLNTPGEDVLFAQEGTSGIWNIL